MSKRLAVLLASAALVAVCLYLVSGRSSELDPDMNAHDFGYSESIAYLVDADAYGAVVMTEDELIGYLRERNSAKVQWRRSLDDIDAYSQYVCGVKCPSFIASGGMPGQEDPEPYTIGNPGLPAEWLNVTGGLNSIAAVDRNGSLRLVSDGPSAESWWELASPYGESQRVRAGGSGLVLFPRVSDRAVVVARTTSTDGAPTTHVFRRTRDGWALASQEERRAAACVSADGSIEIQRGTVIRGGQSFAIEGAADYSSCWLTRDTVVMSQNVSSSSGPSTSVVIADLTGKEVARLDVEDEAAVTTSGVSNLIALSLSMQRTVKVLDAHGQRVGAIEGYTAAQFDESGDLCVLDKDGTPVWFTPAQLSR